MLGARQHVLMAAWQQNSKARVRHEDLRQGARMDNEPRSDRAVQHTYMCSGVTSACAFFLALTCAAAPLTRSSTKYPTSLPIMVQANTQDTYDEGRTVEHTVFRTNYCRRRT